jgi:hypothetical protein
MLRRLLSILLFGATLLPLVAPILSSGAMAQSTLPACCRRAGKHHCAMSAATTTNLIGDKTDSASRHVRVSAPCEKCPYSQRSLGAVHLQVFTAAAIVSPRACVLHAPSATAQAECLRRISFDRSRQKRGPPSLLS